MTTGTAPVSPPHRNDPRQVVNTLKKTVNYNDAGISSGVAFDNSLPLGAFISLCMVEIVTAFNAGSTNALTVGTNSSSYNDIVAAGDVDETATGVTAVGRGWGRSLCASAEKVVKAMYAQTGGAATTGEAVVLIEYEGGWAS
jgi:hypothetical protein